MQLIHVKTYYIFPHCVHVSSCFPLTPLVRLVPYIETFNLQTFKDVGDKGTPAGTQAHARGRRAQRGSGG